ncbi:MAG: hypothetical protein R6U95_09445 [Bacteroidales bacterium]
MPNSKRIHTIFSDVRGKVIKHANIPTVLKKDVVCNLDSQKGMINVTKK